jgi:hypothetical protein
VLVWVNAQVEPDRWYYHCDRLGMLVWQDMPSMYWEDPFSTGPGFRAPGEKRQFERELTRLIEVSCHFGCHFGSCDDLHHSSQSDVHAALLALHVLQKTSHCASVDRH